jgi:nitrogen fixation NifU-like protein
MPEATSLADGHNRLCGDKLRLYVKVHNGIIEDLAFQGEGCSISKSSASLMTEALKGKTIAEAQAMYEKFHDLMTGQDEEDANSEELGKLAALSGVRRFPVRVKCATLPWHTLQAALKNEKTPVSTE